MLLRAAVGDEYPLITRISLILCSLGGEYNARIESLFSREKPGQAPRGGTCSPQQARR
jgi:hypothetical protein